MPPKKTSTGSVTSKSAAPKKVAAAKDPAAAKAARAKKVAAPTQSAAAKKVAPNAPQEQAANRPEPTHAEIAKLAHLRWEKRGREHGSHHADWLHAERELRG